MYAAQLGLAIVPLLPYVFDKPVEGAVDWAFHAAYHSIAGDVPLPVSEKTTTLNPPVRPKGEKRQLKEAPEEQQLAQKAGVSWEEYKEEKLRAREQRKKEKTQVPQSEGGGWLGLWGSRKVDGKKDNEE
jgi:mitochondrial fission process protein 1